MWCIYRITNLVNGKTYIGQHKYSIINDDYMGSGFYLKRAIHKYGVEAFKKDILVAKIPNREYANKAERLYIAKERNKGKAEYNLLDGGQGFVGGHHNENARQKISQSLIGNQRAKGKNIGNQNAKGNVLSKETRQQMSASRMGNANNGIALIKCIETGEVHRTNEWARLGFKSAYQVAKGRQKTCNKLHFIYV